MNTYDLCRRDVVTVRGHEELSTAAWMMRERNADCLVVVESARAGGGWSPVGLLTDRDIVSNVIARECDPRGVVVADVMSRPVTVSADTAVDDALQLMRLAGARRIAVVDAHGRLVGVLAIDDIIDQMLPGIIPAGWEPTGSGSHDPRAARAIRIPPASPPGYPPSPHP